MFSSSSVAPANSGLRNPRRRQRTGSEDSVAARQLPKRLKRSGLTAETFKPVHKTSENGEIYSRDGIPPGNGSLQGAESQRREERNHTRLAIRNGADKKSNRGQRRQKGDSNIELTKNETYSVTRLATTPIQLQDHRSLAKWHGEVAPSIGYAVATTPSEALVWSYKQGANATDTAKPVIIRLLHPSSNVSHPLPLGVLVPSSPEPGLLVIMPVSAKVTYWETLSAAASVDLGRQKQQAVQGTVTGLASGEYITRITEAEPQGFLLTINSGKVVHLTIADPQGKASINAQVLRNTNVQNSGLLGSLRSVFSGAGLLKDIAAVKAGRSIYSGQRECIIGTKKGLLQGWELNWNAAHSLQYEVDAKSKLLESIRDIGSFPRDCQDQYFSVVDLAFLPAVVTGQEVTSSQSRSTTRLLVLTVLSSSEEARYNLHVVDITNAAISIAVVHPINCYRSPHSVETSFYPALFVPEPGQTAYVIFETSIVLVSLEEIEESPNSQLQTEASSTPDPFQDVIDFRKDKDYRVVGCGGEVPERGQHSSACTVMVHGYGMIRISVAPLEGGLSCSERATITAETKLEQAVFYGSQQSLLDFSGRSEIQFTTDEVESAALRISRSITSSSSKYLSNAGPSIEQHLQRRSTALADLINYLRKHYQPLDRRVRWELLWEAEKMAAAKAVWRFYSDCCTASPKGEKVLMYELVECISEMDKTENQPEDHETDSVRHWFIHDVWRIQILVPWATKAMILLYDESVEDNRPMSSAYRGRLIGEAHMIQLLALETAYNFRQDNAGLYGLDEESMADGLLIQGYETLPEFWTSTSLICGAVQKLAEYFQEFAIDLDSHNSSDEEGGSPPQGLLEDIAKNNTLLVDISCKTHIERSRSLNANEDPDVRHQGQKLEQVSCDLRRKLLRGLVNIGQGFEAVKLGEKYRDMEALAEVLESEIQTSQEELKNSIAAGEDTDDLQAKIALCEGYVDEYFDKYGGAWADAFFARFVGQGRVSQLLLHGPKQREHLTRFLRAHPECAVFSWINEVAVEKDYAAAADDLKIAQKQADGVWAKQIQLSISKLAALAAVSNGEKADEMAFPMTREIDGQLEVLDVQVKLHKLLQPVVSRALNDTDAKIEVIMENYGKRFVRAKKALRGALKFNFSKVVAEQTLGAEDLADTITLMDEDALDPAQEFSTRRFLTALQLVRLHSMETGEISRKALLEQIIWRRCIIQDDWAQINRTELKDDAQVEAETGATALFRTLKEGFKSEQDFWEDDPPPEPSSLRGAGTTLESLRTSSRYNTASDSALSLIGRDLQIEDEVLEACIVEGRLEEWWKGIVDAARTSARNEADRKGEENSRQQAAEQEFRDRMRRKDQTAWGVENGVEREVEMDEEGDVAMGM
ncbi:MAG: hypothetical protein Q9219_006679 [cf. Caloplaca sp. 3 TL-2023]